MNNFDFTYPDFRFRGTVDAPLAERYGWRDREKRIKDDAALARRTATQLSKTVESFRWCAGLDPETTLAITAGASAMKKLAARLENMKPWAKAYTQWEGDRDAARERFEVAAFARARWPDDAACRAETDILRAWCGEDGENFVQYQGQHLGLQLMNFHRPCVDVRSVPAGEAVLPADKFREVVARLVLELRYKGGRGHINGDRYFAGFDDYEAFVAARAGAKAAAESALVAASSVVRGQA